MLANAQRFISATPYSDIPFDEQSMEDAFVLMMECGLCIIDVDAEGNHLGGAGAIKGPLYFNNNVQIAMERFWWVVPDERAKGVGKALYQALESSAKDAGCTHLMMIGLDNEVYQLYERLGFKKTEEVFIKRL